MTPNAEQHHDDFLRLFAVATLAEAAECSSQRLEVQREAWERCLGKLPESRRQLVLSAYEGRMGGEDGSLRCLGAK